MKHYLITLIHNGGRIVRNVIAPNSIKAGLIALAMMPDTDEPCAVICKPLRRLT
jgi:hypothetical protein